jgi:hypothetical protein
VQAAGSNALLTRVRRVGESRTLGRIEAVSQLSMDSIAGIDWIIRISYGLRASASIKSMRAGIE